MLGRQSIVLVCVTSFSGLFIASCKDPAGEADYSRLHSPSSIRGDRYELMVDKMRDFAEKHRNFVEYINYGTSVRGLPLSLLKISNRMITDTKDAPAIVLSEAIHGDEFLNIAVRLPERFLENNVLQTGFHQFLDKGGALYLTPVQNPDGYERVRRENANGKDLNRDYPLQRANKDGFTQPETESLISFIRRDLEASGRTVKLSWDYHCCVGALIYPWGYSTRDRLEADHLARHRAVAKDVQSIFGYPAGTAMQIVNYTALGASDDYHFETYRSLAFTFEGEQRKEASNLEKHVVMWDGLFRRVVSMTSRQVYPHPLESTYPVSQLLH